MAQSVHARLAAHPANPPPIDQRIDATLARRADGGLAITYAVHGLNVDLRIPTAQAPPPSDALWRSSCCELFIAADDRAAYREFNFSPTGQWAAHDFSDYRQRLPGTPDCPAPVLTFKRNELMLRLDVEIAPAALPAGGTLRLAVTAVLEARDGRCGYYAFAHPAGKPDFHHRAGFGLTLDASGFHT